MLSTLLETKLHRPRPTSNLVARPRLTQCLDEGLRNGHRLFLVVAPAGYGKTTLVTDWLDRTGLPCAWLSLDEADNDPLRFFTYVVAALQKTLGPKLAQPLLEAFPTMPQPPEAFVHPLINDLAAVDRQIEKMPPLALDYARLLRDVKVQEAVYELLVAQYEEARIQETKDTPTVEVLDPARKPQKKVRPVRWLFVLSLTAAAGILSLGVAFTSEALRGAKSPDRAGA